VPVMFWHDGFTVATFVPLSHPISALFAASRKFWRFLSSHGLPIELRRSYKNNRQE
jgi:hypothetical protein